MANRFESIRIDFPITTSGQLHQCRVRDKVSDRVRARARVRNRVRDRHRLSVKQLGGELLHQRLTCISYSRLVQQKLAPL